MYIFDIRLGIIQSLQYVSRKFTENMKKKIYVINDDMQIKSILSDVLKKCILLPTVKVR